VIIPQDDNPMIRPSRAGPRYVGHTHFWERAMMSRRQFIGTAVGATGAVLASGLWTPGLALAAGSDPNPIPGGFVFNGQLFHVFGLGEGNEPSTITDFKGSVGVADVQGTGIGINTLTGHHETLNFDTDMRFMQGAYIGMDGNKHHGTFGFI
jgi:hypothetical protein